MRDLLLVGGQVEEAEYVVRQLESEAEDLNQESVWVSSTDYKEQEIRRHLLMAKPDEKVMVFPPGASQLLFQEQQTPELLLEQQQLQPIWQRWLMVFGLNLGW